VLNTCLRRGEKLPVREVLDIFWEYAEEVNLAEMLSTCVGKANRSVVLRLCDRPSGR